jgi:hypothetical protein
LTYTTTGLVNGNTLTGALATTATTASNVGIYGITQGTLAASANYALTYVGADLTVTGAAPPVPANAQSVVFPSSFISNDFLINGGDGFAAAHFAQDSDASGCTPARVRKALNRHGRVDLTGGSFAWCK